MAWYSPGKKRNYSIDSSKKSTTHNNLTSTTRGTTGVKYIVIHYTGSGTAATKGIALANCEYFNRANRNASADFFIDNTTIARYNPNCKSYYSWHCGDGGGAYGITNANSIGVEVASSGKAFTPREKRRLRWLVQKLMKIYNIDEKHVVRHYDASHKLCPLPYCGTDAKDKKWLTLRKRLCNT